MAYRQIHPIPEQKIMKILIFIIPLIIYSSLAFYPLSVEANDTISFDKNDRVLILAPHPDDETIGAAGAIQKALAQGAKVKVVCFTNGDSNELAFIVYEKRLTLRKGEFLHMGGVRRRETVRAMVYLGLRQEDVIFLGYPDFGTMEILTKYWGDTKPFRSLFTRVSKVSYPEAMSVNAPYVGESILKDLKKLLLEFKPTKIFVSHPADVNRDHRSLYVFLQVAMWDLGAKIKRAETFPYIIHVVRWPLPRGYHPELRMDIPNQLVNSGISWRILPLSEEELKTKHDAISFYKSQIEYAPAYLYTFARKNELFGDFPVIRLEHQDTGEISWQDLETPLNIKVDPERKKESIGRLMPDISYAHQGNMLLIRLYLKRKIDKDLGVSMFLFGYNKRIDFGRMPKIYIWVDTLGLHVRDKKKQLQVKDIELETRDDALILRVPLSTLGNPERILTLVRTHPNKLPLDETSWRILYLAE